KVRKIEPDRYAVDCFAAKTGLLSLLSNSGTERFSHAVCSARLQIKDGKFGFLMLVGTQGGDQFIVVLHEDELLAAWEPLDLTNFIGINLVQRSRFDFRNEDVIFVTAEADGESVKIIR